MEASLFNQPAKDKPEQVKVFTISQVTSLIKTALENSLPGRITVTGQISGFKRHSSGH
jgi:exonuclease VII large subunit